MMSMGIGYYTLHSSRGTYLAIGQDTQYPMEGISLYKCYSGCAFQFLQVLHCTVATHWAKTPCPQAHFYWALGGRRKQFSLCCSRCTSEVYFKISLHLVVMVAGPAALLGRKLRLRPIVNSKNDNISRSGSSLEDFLFFLLPFCGGYNPAKH